MNNASHELKGVVTFQLFKVLPCTGLFANDTTRKQILLRNRERKASVLQVLALALFNNVLPNLCT